MGAPPAHTDPVREGAGEESDNLGDPATLGAADSAIGGAIEADAGLAAGRAIFGITISHSTADGESVESGCSAESAEAGASAAA